jgi:hypothetical protein
MPYLPKIGEELGFASIIAALLIFMTESSSKQELNRLFSRHLATNDLTISKGIADIEDSLNKGIRNIETTLDNGIVRIVAMSSLTDFPSQIDIQAKAVLVRQIAHSIHATYIDGMHIHRDGFTLDDTDWAVESASRFFRALGSLKLRDLSVLVTHTGSVDVWTNEEEVTPALLDQEMLNRSLNVKINRIFVGSEELPLKENSKYIGVMKMMVAMASKSIMSIEKSRGRSWILHGPRAGRRNGLGAATRGRRC